MTSVAVMEREGVGSLDKYPGIFVKQTKKGCLQELMGCEANTEFKIFETKESAKNDAAMIMYTLENTSCPMRFCCGNNRPFQQTINLGTKDNVGGPVLKMDRPLACPMSPCQCCCIQTISFMAGDELPIGSASIPFFCCVPAIKVLDASGAHVHTVQMPTCMGGLCVDCMAEGCCNCKIPFYVFAPGVAPAKENQIGKIVKMWRGLGTEVFTDAASFQVDFPTDADAAAKGRLLGTTFFINMIFFEEKNQ